jgi:hypothetical protein
MESIVGLAFREWRRGRAGRAAPIGWWAGARCARRQAGGPRANPPCTTPREIELATCGGRIAMPGLAIGATVGTLAGGTAPPAQARVQSAQPTPWWSGAAGISRCVPPARSPAQMTDL